MITLRITIKEEDNGIIRIRGASDDKGITEGELNFAQYLLTEIDKAQTKGGWQKTQTIIPLTIIRTKGKKNK